MPCSVSSVARRISTSNATPYTWAVSNRTVMYRLSNCTLLLIAVSCYLVYSSQAKALQVSVQRVGEKVEQAQLDKHHLISFICYGKAAQHANKAAKVKAINLPQASKFCIKTFEKSLALCLSLRSNAILAAFWFEVYAAASSTNFPHLSLPNFRIANCAPLQCQCHSSQFISFH